MIALMFVGCGGNGSNTNDSTSNIIAINEFVEGQDLSIVVTEFEIPMDDLGKDNYTMDGSHYQFVKDGYVNRLIHFKAKNISKVDVAVIYSAILVYDEGYRFDPAKYWYYAKDVYTSDMKHKGVWLNDVQEIGTFDEGLDCVVAFLIPEEATNNDKPLSVEVSVEGASFACPVR